MDDQVVVIEKGKPKRRGMVMMGRALGWMKKFVPVFLLFMILPFLVAFVLKPPEVKFFTGARGEKNNLRVWIEPSSVVVGAGEGVDLVVMANFESDDKLVAGLKVAVVAPGGVSLSKMNVEADKPFKGQMMIGTVRATVLKSGSYEIKIPEELVETQEASGPLKIVTGSASLSAQ